MAASLSAKTRAGLLGLRYRHVVAILALTALAVALLQGLHQRDPMVQQGDSPAYLAGAYHLAHEGVFSEERTAQAVPGIGREPGYAFLLAGLMRLDPDGFGRAAPDCVAVAGGCGSIYRGAQRLNVALFVLAAAGVAGTLALLPGGTPLAVLIAGLYILLNGQTVKWAAYLVSDMLALFLVALAGLLFAAALAWRHASGWVPLGFVLGALTLTKGIFAVFLGPVILVAIAAGVIKRSRSLVIAALVVGLGFGAVTGAWIARNAAITGRPTLSDERGGIALSTREALMHMDVRTYAASIVFWTRGIGDQAAAQLFGEETVAPLRLETRGGLYDVGQNGYDPRVAAAEAEGLDRRAASRRVDGEIVRSIMGAPVAYLTSMLPIFYRGIWGDEFILLGLPCLTWLSLLSVRQRSWPIFGLLALGWFNLAAYAAISLNIPRYQITAVPSLAWASGLVLSLAIGGGSLRMDRGEAVRRPCEPG